MTYPTPFKKQKLSTCANRIAERDRFTVLQNWHLIIVFVMLILASAFSYKPLFDVPIGLSTRGLNITSFTMADFDNDGYLDIVSASDDFFNGELYDKLDYFKNNGDGTFSEAVQIDAGSNLTTMLPGDFNGDGWRDLVALSATTSYPQNFYVLVFLNDGTGTLAFHTVYTKISTPYITVLDINNDGFDDILQMDFSQLKGMFSNGDGTFTFGNSGEEMVNISIDPFSFGQMRAWDVNHDEFSDLLVFGSKTITPPVGDPYAQSFISTYTNMGDTTFTLASEYLYVKDQGVIVSSNDPGYFNNDNNKDLLIRDSQNHFSILSGNTDGSFTLHNSMDLTTTFKTTHGDINGDGLEDILISDRETATISAMMNNGDSEITFSEPVEFKGKWTSNPAYPPAIVSDDLNNDGLDDIIISFYNFTILLNHGDGTYPGLPAIENMGVEAFDMLSEDFNNDGFIDLMTMDKDRLYLSFSDANGYFTVPQILYSGLEWQNGIIPGYFNTDSIPDFAVTKGLKLFYGTGDGTFTPGPAYGDSIPGLSAIDGMAGYLNDDDYIDFALYFFGSLRVVLSDSSGSYHLTSHVFSDDGISQIRDLVIYDIDQDNDQDILFGFLEGIYINYNDGSGGFDTYEVLTSGGAAGQLNVNDFNYDGFPDIAATHYDHVGIHFNNGDGTFTAVVTYGMYAQGAYKNLESEDMDGDGFTDLIATHSATRELIIFINDGDGIFSHTQVYSAGENPVDFLISDFNKDSEPDIAVTSSVAGMDYVYILLNGYEPTTAIQTDQKIQNQPKTAVLFPNYPNPFNPTTNIRYTLYQAGAVHLIIYNILGQEVVTLVSKYQAAGVYQISWDASGFPSGVYICQIQTANGIAESKKLMLLK